MDAGESINLPGLPFALGWAEPPVAYGAVRRRLGRPTIRPVPPTAAPSAVEAPHATAAVPTPVSAATPSASPSAPALEGASLELHCGGGLMQSSIIDYANEARGVTDILAATRALRGVAATDLVVTHGNSTVVIRDGQAIWRGDWSNMGRGFLLGQSSACEGVQIGL